MALMLRAGWARIPVSSPSRRFHRQFLQAAFPRSASPVTRAAAPAAIQPRPAHCNSKGFPSHVASLNRSHPPATAAMASAGEGTASSSGAFGHQLGLEVVEIYNPEELNFILGHAHFIKTVEDLYEALVAASPSLKFGIAFCEASEGHGDMAGRRVRFDGNDAKLIEVAKKNALALGAGHTFVVFLDGGFPVSVLNTIKAVPEVCRVHCATANPTAVVLGTLGTDRKGILGVIDGMISTAYETEEDKQARHSFLRMIGYKR